MKPLDPVEMYLALVKSFRWVREQPRNSNRGQAIEAMLAACGGAAGEPWCAALVSYCGMLIPGWPLPIVRGCATLAEAAEKKGLLRTTPARGAIFLIWYPALKRFAHTGACDLEKRGGLWHTAEGNTSDPLAPATREGWGCFERDRTFKPADRFIYWWEV